MENLRPSALSASRPIGVYVHFPWCLRKCPYCDFTSFEATRDAIDHDGYADAVLRELSLRRESLEGRQVRSLYFGGGTPSLWETRALGRIIAVLEAECEITVECNPSSFDRAKAQELRGVGVNRVSIGVQGLDAGRLSFLGRLHDGPHALAAVDAALEAGFPRVSADLIYGVERENALEAALEAQRLAATGVGHISAYALTIEPATRFGELHRQGRLPLVRDDVMVDSFLAVREALAQAGFSHYEISSFARPEQESRHNLGYWRGDDYLGLGCAAWGTLSRPSDGSAYRYRNPPVPSRYLAQVASGDLAPHEIEELDPETRLRERVMLGLRTREGIDLEHAAQELGVDPWPVARRREVAQLLEAGRLRQAGSRLQIPPDAWIFADGIAASLF